MNSNFDILLHTSEDLNNVITGGRGSHVEHTTGTRVRFLPAEGHGKGTRVQNGKNGQLPPAKSRFQSVLGYNFYRQN